MISIRSFHPIGKKLYRTRPISVETDRNRSILIVVDRIIRGRHSDAYTSSTGCVASLRPCRYATPPFGRTAYTKRRTQSHHHNQAISTVWASTRNSPILHLNNRRDLSKVQGQLITCSCIESSLGLIRIQCEVSILAPAQPCRRLE